MNEFALHVRRNPLSPDTPSASVSRAILLPVPPGPGVAWAVPHPATYVITIKTKLLTASLPACLLLFLLSLPFRFNPSPSRSQNKALGFGGVNVLGEF